MPRTACGLIGPHNFNELFLGKARWSLLSEADKMLNAWFKSFCEFNPQEVNGKRSEIFFYVLKKEAFQELSHRCDNTPHVRRLCGCLAYKNPPVFYHLAFVSRLDDALYKIILPLPSPLCDSKVVFVQLIRHLKKKDQTIVLNEWRDILRVRTLLLIREWIMEIADIVPFHYFDLSDNGMFLGHFASKLRLPFSEIKKDMQDSEVHEFKNLQSYLKAAHIVQVGTTETNPFRGVNSDTMEQCREIVFSGKNQRSLKVAFWEKFREFKARSLYFPEGVVDFEAYMLGKRKCPEN
jgi:hypothetical protein